MVEVSQELLEGIKSLGITKKPLKYAMTMRALQIIGGWASALDIVQSAEHMYHECTNYRYSLSKPATTSRLHILCCHGWVEKKRVNRKTILYRVKNEGFK